MAVSTVDYDDTFTSVSERECSAIAADAVKEVLRRLDLGEPTHYQYSCRSKLEGIALREIQDYCHKNSKNGKKVTNRKICHYHGQHAVRDFLRRNSSFLQPNTSTPKVRNTKVIDCRSGIARCTSISS